MQVERALCASRLLEADHGMLERLFPRHIIEQIASSSLSVNGEDRAEFPPLSSPQGDLIHCLGATETSSCLSPGMQSIVAGSSEVADWVVNPSPHSQLLVEEKRAPERHRSVRLPTNSSTIGLPSLSTSHKQASFLQQTGRKVFCISLNSVITTAL